MKVFICLLALASVASATVIPEYNYLCRGVPETMLLVHPFNCRAYISCVGGIATQQICNDNLYFNQLKQYCDHPELVNCKPGGGIVNPENPERQIDERCVQNDPLKELTLAHSTDCDKFLMCDGPWAVTMACPVGLHFNTKLSLCDFPEQAGCVAK